MPKGNSVPCELCSSNIAVGLIYEFEPGIFICDECRDKLVKIEGFWFDGHAAEQKRAADVLESPAKKHRFPNTLNSLRRLARKIAHR